MSTEFSNQSVQSVQSVDNVEKVEDIDNVQETKQEEQKKEETDTSDSGDDNFVIMTKKESKIWVLLQNGKPIATSFNKAKLSEKLNHLIRETTIEFNSIGPVYVDFNQDKFTLSMKNRNMFWATERVIAVLEIELIDCI